MDAELKYVTRLPYVVSASLIRVYLRLIRAHPQGTMEVPSH